MSTINEAFINALLADASYVDGFEAGRDAAEFERLLKDRMTPALAKFIADNFTASSASDVSDTPLDGSDFDAVVWRGLPNGLFPGGVHVSMRGIEPRVEADLFVADFAAANTRRRAERGDARWRSTLSSTLRAARTHRSRSTQC